MDELDELASMRKGTLSPGSYPVEFGVVPIGQVSDVLQAIVATVRAHVQDSNIKTLSASVGISIANLYRFQRGGLPRLENLEVLAYFFSTGEKLKNPKCRSAKVV